MEAGSCFPTAKMPNAGNALEIGTKGGDTESISDFLESPTLRTHPSSESLSVFFQALILGIFLCEATVVSDWGNLNSLPFGFRGGCESPKLLPNGHGSGHAEESHGHSHGAKEAHGHSGHASDSHGHSHGHAH